MPKLSENEIQQALGQLAGWRRTGNVIERVFEFPNFVKAIDFVNLVAQAAEQANHHPDITINYNKVVMALTSHDSGGVTERDIKLAGRINQLAPQPLQKAG
jgi:4a-hydroxytetrahydrobiopterin dehydratase